ncbi:hypothetical protein ACLOJK_006655, partial [Asimina triloba]
ICTDEGVHGKRMKAVKGVIVIEDIRINQKDVDFRHLGHLMKLCPSDGLWVRSKTSILSGAWRECNGSFMGLAPPRSASSSTSLFFAKNVQDDLAYVADQWADDIK